MTIGFIGAGNMGGTLAAAAAKAGCGAILLADADSDKAAALARRIGAAAADNAAVAEQCDYIFLGVKPQVLEEVTAPLTAVLSARGERPVLVSMAAGVSIGAVAAMTGNTCPIIRIMPNTPAAVGAGMMLYAAGEGVTDRQTADFERIMAASGRLLPVAERLIDAGSAVSGCGPAFVYLFIEALADGGVECGLPRAMAQELAAQTVLGAAKMVLEDGRHPSALKDAVCSPGGTTIAGVHALEAGGFRALGIDAVCAAYDRTMKLKQ